MTPHNKGEAGDYAKVVLCPGDPLRATMVAERYLKDARLVSDVRGIPGYTGTFQGIPCLGDGHRDGGRFHWNLQL
ncbi:MAG: hypothetical protein LKE28_08430 [Sphaerochaeta sp.]|nr:hypothetical protein [Sphaerochaeta sp.]